jgi:hypothetical protein
MIRFIFAVVEQFDVPRAKLNDNAVGNVLQIVFGIAGAIALVMLMLAAMKYVVSRGDPGEVAKAKNAILYSVIGLIIVATAFAIVSFVVKKV